MYLEPSSEIRGTWDLSIFKLEKHSMRVPHFYINTLYEKPNLTSSVFRVYEMNCLQTLVFKETPIPYLFKGLVKHTFKFDSSV